MTHLNGYNDEELIRFSNELLWVHGVFRKFLRIVGKKRVSPLVYAWIMANLARIAREGLLQSEKLPTEAVLRLDRMEVEEVTELFVQHLV